MRAAVWPVHFGSDYLAHGVRSVQDAVDELHIFYAPRPSYGFSVPGAVNPDTEEHLFAEAHRFLKPGKELYWHTVTGTRWEGQHRDLMTATLKRRGCDLYVTLDADEIWEPETAQQTLDTIWERNKAGRWLCHFHHFWQSFQWMVVDSFRPIRVVDLRHPIDGSCDEYTTLVEQPTGVFHFGYAQREAIMRYKFTCHSHSAEIGGHINKWLDEVFFPWEPTPERNRNLHPAQPTVWIEAIPTPLEVTNKLRAVLGDHPYWGRHPIR